MWILISAFAGTKHKVTVSTCGSPELRRVASSHPNLRVRERVVLAHSCAGVVCVAGFWKTGIAASSLGPAGLRASLPVQSGFLTSFGRGPPPVCLSCAAVLVDVADARSSNPFFMSQVHDLVSLTLRPSAYAHSGKRSPEVSLASGAERAS